MSKESLIVSRCPTCGSPRICKVREDWKGSYRGTTYTVEDLEYYACPDCQERVYPPAAMRQIQQASPAYATATAVRARRSAGHAARR